MPIPQSPRLPSALPSSSGPVVVDATGEIFGDVPNIAARAALPAGSVVVTARVQRQVGGLFVAEERGSHELKGVPEPVTLFRIVRASGGGRRAGQRHLTRLVGREEELAMLTRRCERARQGDGHLVLIVGEPGVGKSRLVEEFHGRLARCRTLGRMELFAAPAEHATASDRRMGRLGSGGADVPAEQRLTDLESSLAQVKLDPRRTPLYSRHCWISRCQRWRLILAPSATGLSKPDLHVFAKLFEDCLKRGLEAQAFSGREIGGHDDVLDFLVGHFVDVDLTRQPAS